MNVDDYLSLPYHITMVRDESGGGAPATVVWVEELPGCISQGETPAEAAQMIDDAMRGWLQVSIDHNDPIPAPRRDSSHSGKMMVRLPAGLHAVLDDAARSDRVSLNQFISSALAGAVNWRPAGQASPPKARARRTAPRSPENGSTAQPMRHTPGAAPS